jgi:hypothetical protein
MTDNTSVARAKIPLILCLTQLSLFGATAAHSADPNVDKLCPEAAQEHAQLLAKRHTPKDVATVTRPALRKELLEMEQRDQDARSRMVAAMAAADLADDDPTRVHTRQVDADNLRRLKHIIIQDGFPTITLVGVDGVQAAFLLTQHADTDPEFQEKILKVVTQRYQSGEINGNALALLTDRVLRAKGKPQRYGTQFEERDGDWKPQPLADESHVDERRHALGLVSLANYSCVIHAAYGPASPPPAK